MARQGMALDGMGIAWPADELPCHVVQGHPHPPTPYHHGGVLLSLLASLPTRSYAHALLLAVHLG